MIFPVNTSLIGGKLCYDIIYCLYFLPSFPLFRLNLAILTMFVVIKIIDKA